MMTVRRMTLVLLLVAAAMLAGCDKNCTTCGSPTAPRAPKVFTATASWTATATATATCADGTRASATAEVTVTETASAATLAEAEALALQKAKERAEVEAKVKAEASVVCGTPKPPPPPPPPPPSPPPPSPPPPPPPPSPPPSPSCTYAVQNTALSYDYRGGNSGIVVSASSQTCTWSVAPSIVWIGVSPTSGTGNGSFSITVAGNGGGARTGNVIFTGMGGFTRTIPVSQAGQ